MFFFFPSGVFFFPVCVKLKIFPLQTHRLFPRLLKRLRCVSGCYASLEKLQRLFASVIFKSNPPPHLDSIHLLFLPFFLAFCKEVSAVVEAIHPHSYPHTNFVVMKWYIIDRESWDF